MTSYGQNIIFILKMFLFKSRNKKILFCGIGLTIVISEWINNNGQRSVWERLCQFLAPFIKMSVSTPLSSVDKMHFSRDALQDISHIFFLSVFTGLCFTALCRTSFSRFKYCTSLRRRRYDFLCRLLMQRHDYAFNSFISNFFSFDTDCMSL